MKAKHPLGTWLTNAPITRTKFAESIGCSPPHLTLVSQGKRGASLELALAIQRETGGEVTVEHLLEGKQERARASR